MIIDGRKLADKVLNNLKREFVNMDEVKIGIIAIENDAPALSFAKQKQKIAQKLGVEIEIIPVSSKISEIELRDKLKQLADDPEIQGIILQLPLPAHLPIEEIVKYIPKEKDIDGLNPQTLVLSPAVLTVELIFKEHNIDYQNKLIVLNGLGRLVGGPMLKWLISENIRPAVITDETDGSEKRKLLQSADIIISGVGKPGLIKADSVKKGVAMIDFGCGLENGRIKGDAQQAIADKASVFTPTPKGTGPILVSMIFQNLLNLCLT